MLRTKLYLTDSSTAGETAIYAACYLDGKRKKIYLPITVQPQQWDVKGQKFRRSFPNFSDANNLLKKLPDEFEAVHLQQLNKGVATTPDDLRAVAARLLGGAPPSHSAGLLEQLKSWMDACRRDKTASTIKSYQTLLNHLGAYAKQRRLQLEFSNVDVAFCEAFKTYLLRTVGLANTSINNNVKYLKAFLNATFEQGLHEYAHFKRFRKLEAIAPDVVYLTIEEVASLTELQLNHIPYLAQTRDIFLFGCETSLRFSDIKALRSEQVKKDHLLITTQKTADLLSIPLSPLAQSIIARYAGRADGRALPVISNQKTNAYLKILGKIAHIDTPTTITQQKGSERITTTHPKYELICTHTARRTFVTLALETGVRPEVVMNFTGHKDYKTLHRYLKITDAVAKVEIKKYFNRQIVLNK